MKAVDDNAYVKKKDVKRAKIIAKRLIATLLFFEHRLEIVKSTTSWGLE